MKSLTLSMLTRPVSGSRNASFIAVYWSPHSFLRKGTMANAPGAVSGLGGLEVVEVFDHVEVVEDRGADGDGDAHDLDGLGLVFRGLVVLRLLGCHMRVLSKCQRCARRTAGAGCGHFSAIVAVVTLAMYSTLVEPLMRSLGLALMVTP